MGGRAGPVVPDADRDADAFEHLADVPCVEGGTVAGGEHQPGVPPVVPGREPLADAVGAWLLAHAMFGRPIRKAGR